ncbi:hypothetical protein [Romboutsia sp.]|uniref:hypothetical protein n=1 Tax=Romboutsia sp. TaxID=1965302 RepID=UPI002B720E2D|nr:hypothetical protein [Romboutsia sp.]HSQ89378.1 hypothetical protein [Romboutsia sp.]
MNEQKLKKNFNNIKNDTLQEVCMILRNSNFDVYNNLADFISALFNVEKADMLSKDLDRENCRARWMWWLTLYTYYDKSYENIANLSSYDDSKVEVGSVGYGVNKIQEEMQNSVNLRDKWFQVKTLINSGRNLNNYSNKSVDAIRPKVKISVSKDVDLDIVRD